MWRLLDLEVGEGEGPTAAQPVNCTQCIPFLINGAGVQVCSCAEPGTIMKFHEQSHLSKNRGYRV
jgi:hypothetical protein